MIAIQKGRVSRITSLGSQKPAGATAIWTPASASGLKLWGKKGVGWWQDTAGTTPAVVTNDPIARVDDQSGNGNNLTQATASKQGKLSSLGGIALDAVDDSINIAHPAFNYERTQPWTIFVKFRVNGLAAARMLISKVTNTSFVGFYIIVTTSGQIQVVLANSSGNRIIVSSTNSITINNDYRLIVTYNGNSLANGITINLNGTDETLVVTQNNLSLSILNTVNFGIGGLSNGAAFPTDGQEYEFGLYDNVISSTDKANLNTYLVSV